MKTQIQTRKVCENCEEDLKNFIPTPRSDTIGYGDFTLYMPFFGCGKCQGGYIYSKWYDCELARLPVVQDGKTLRYLNTVVFREEI